MGTPRWARRWIRGRGVAKGVGAERLVVAQADVCWAELPSPTGSGPGLRGPVIVVQGEPFNRSRISTVVCIPLTSNLHWADAPGNVLLPARTTGLAKIPWPTCRRSSPSIERSSSSASVIFRGAGSISCSLGSISCSVAKNGAGTHILRRDDNQADGNYPRR